MRSGVNPPPSTSSRPGMPVATSGGAALGDEGSMAIPGTRPAAGGGAFFYPRTAALTGDLPDCPSEASGVPAGTRPTAAAGGGRPDGRESGGRPARAGYHAASPFVPRRGVDPMPRRTPLAVLLGLVALSSAGRA